MLLLCSKSCCGQPALGARSPQLVAETPTAPQPSRGGRRRLCSPITWPSANPSFLPRGFSLLPVMLPGSSGPQNSGLTSSPGLCLASCLSHVASPTPRCCSSSPESAVLCEHRLDPAERERRISAPAGLCRGRRWQWLRSVLGAVGAQGQAPQGDFWSGAPLEVNSGPILQDPTCRRGSTALPELGGARGLCRIGLQLAAGRGGPVKDQGSSPRGCDCSGLGPANHVSNEPNVLISGEQTPKTCEL